MKNEIVHRTQRMQCCAVLEITATITIVLISANGADDEEKIPTALNVYTRIYGCHAGALFSHFIMHWCSIIGSK